jgi:hypothetical protein
VPDGLSGVCRECDKALAVGGITASIACRIAMDCFRQSACRNLAKGDEAMDTQSKATEPASMQAEPQAEHRWLQQLVGEWTNEAQMTMAPESGESCKGTESVRSLGGLWVLAEGRGEMPGGGSATMLMTLGYDPAKQRYVGTWVGSMMTHLWVYDGELDASGKILTLNSEGPDMSPGAAPGKLVSYRDVIEFKTADHRTLTSFCQDENGNWQQIMTADYRRTK